MPATKKGVIDPLTGVVSPKGRKEIPGAGKTLFNNLKKSVSNDSDKLPVVNVLETTIKTARLW
jgi:hypothetical protein